MSRTIQQLDIPTWEHNKKAGTIVSNPTWDDVESAIRNLDGKSKNTVYLTPDSSDPETFLGIGGGPKKFILTGAVQNETYPTLINSSADMQAAEIELVVGGQAANFPANWIHELDTTLKAAKYFWQTSEFAGEDLIWEFV